VCASRRHACVPTAATQRHHCKHRLGITPSCSRCGARAREAARSCGSRKAAQGACACGLGREAREREGEGRRAQWQGFEERRWYLYQARAEKYLAELRQEMRGKGACQECGRAGRIGPLYNFETCFDEGHLMVPKEYSQDGLPPTPCDVCLQEQCKGVDLYIYN
jgi:hypothetical protein